MGDISYNWAKRNWSRPNKLTRRFDEWKNFDKFLTHLGWCISRPKGIQISNEKGSDHG